MIRALFRERKPETESTHLMIAKRGKRWNSHGAVLDEVFWSEKVR